MSPVETAIERFAVSLTVAVTTTLIIAVVWYFPSSPLWTIVLGAWIGALFHFIGLILEIWREARQ